MTITRLHLLSMLSLIVFGFLVLIISLVATNRSALGQVVPLSAVQFYTHGPILPDHPLYPLLMVRDRIALMQAEGESKIILQVTYADERRQRAMLLMKKGHTERAVTTLSKSQKYLLEATYLAVAAPTSLEMRQEMSLILTQSLLYLETIADATGDAHRSALDQLTADTLVAQDQLSKSVANNY